MRQASFPVLLLSLVAGALAVAGFAPLTLWPLPILSLAVLFGLLARTPSRRAGFLIGLGCQRRNRRRSCIRVTGSKWGYHKGIT